MRFVIADDGPVPRNILKRIITEAGHEVVGAGANGAEGLDLARKHKPDVVVFDIVMPKMTGTEAAKLVIAEDLAKFVFVASLTTQNSVVAPVEQLGARIIAKPFRSEQMVAAFRAAGIPCG